VPASDRRAEIDSSLSSISAKSDNAITDPGPGYENRDGGRERGVHAPSGAQRVATCGYWQGFLFSKPVKSKEDQGAHRGVGSRGMRAKEARRKGNGSGQGGSVFQGTIGSAAVL
jgi:hypothetical protein